MSEQSNEDIRVKVAQILGYRRADGWRASSIVSSWVNSEGMYWHTLPDWTGSMDASQALSDKLKQEGWSETHNRPSLSSVWTVNLARGYREFTVDDPTLPRAISKAFIEAHPSP